MKIVIVGAGVFGSWTALLLTRAGHQVTLIDRHGPANQYASSAGESRIIRSAYGSDEIYTVMARRSLQLWRSFFKDENCPEYFRETGVLWIAPADEPTVSDAQGVFDRVSVPYELLTSHAIIQRWPEFKLECNAGALFEPEAGALLAEKSVKAVVDAAIRAGAGYETADILPPILDQSLLRFVESLDGRRFEADLFVFACGSWLPKLFEVLDTIIRPTRQELFFFTPPQRLARNFLPGALPIWIDQTEPKIAYGFPDLGHGVKLGFHHLGPEFDPDSPRSGTPISEREAAANYLESRLPRMQRARLDSTQICHYENTPNGDFLIDVHPEAKNVWLVGGGSGHGFKHGPAVAEYVLDSISGMAHCEPRFSLEANKSATSRRVL